ncbi:MAG: class I SAM-dependent methyltransferase [bacterium]|nr:class I SAM-dependent methyltransferase [bacterium]
MSEKGAACQVCGSRGQPHLNHKGMALSRCPNCGLIFMDPMPDNATLQALYADGYGGTTKVYFPKAASKLRRCRRRARWLARWTTGRRFLDVGCNGGFMAQAMHERGFKSHGIDPDPISITWAREHYPDVCFVKATAETYLPDAGLFDVVYCSEVIEHAPDANRFVSAVAALMAPGGVLFLTTPDISHWRRPRDITAWDAFTPPNHCLYFNPSNLTLLLANHRLHVVRRRLVLKPGIQVLARKEVQSV